jgi:hypothetical protein
MLALGFLVVDLIEGRRQIAEEFDVLAQVFVMPFPLITGDLNVQTGLSVVVHSDQGSGGGNGHDDQYQQRYHRPHDLDFGVFVEFGSHLPGGAPMGDHRPEHRAEHDNPDHHTDPENDHVQVENVMAHLGRARGHIRCPGRVRLTEYRPQQKSHPDVWMPHHCEFPFCSSYCQQSLAGQGAVVKTVT